MKVRVGFARTTAEGAELASDETDIREIDVAIDHVGDEVADEIAPEGVGGYEKGEQVGAFCVRQNMVFFIGEACCILLLEDAVESATDCGRSGGRGFIPGEIGELL
jgi:hypothetical protein